MQSSLSAIATGECCTGPTQRTTIVAKRMTQPVTAPWPSGPENRPRLNCLSGARVRSVRIHVIGRCISELTGVSRSHRAYDVASPPDWSPARVKPWRTNAGADH
jgi:hypothetical protein